MKNYNIHTMKNLILLLVLVVTASVFGCSHNQSSSIETVNTLSPVILGSIKAFGKQSGIETNKTSINEFSVAVGESSTAASMSTPISSVTSTSYIKESANKADVALLKAGLTAKSFAVVENLSFSSSAANCLVLVSTMTYATMSGKIYLLKAPLLVK